MIMNEKYFRIPYIIFGEFDELVAYVKAENEDEAKRKLIFYLSEEKDAPFSIEELTFGLIEEIKIIN